MSKHIVNNSLKRWFHAIPETRDPLYVTDWYTDNGLFYAIGVRDGKFMKLQMKYITPGLYLWALDVNLVYNLLINLMPEDASFEIVTVNNEHLYYYNNFVSTFDSVVCKERYGRNWKLCKIVTKTFEDTKSMYYQIAGNHNFCYYVGVLGQWTLVTFLNVEMHIRGGDSIFCVGLDGSFKYVDMDQIDLPTVVFDIETVSNHDYRLPMGNYVADHIMSVTVVIDEDMYTIFNLPLSDGNVEEKKKAQQILDSVDASKYQYVKRRHCYVVNTEIALLRKLLELFDSVGGPYLCLGYNSRGYDMPFLFNRCMFLNMKETKNFFYINGILSYGINMLHFDLHQIVVKYFAFEVASFSLDKVAQALLDQDEDMRKIKFNSINLRYIYKYISERDNINHGKFDNVLCNKPHNVWSVDLKLLVQYNEMDCMVVLALWNKLQFEDFMHYTSNNFVLPFVRAHLSKLSEYLSGNTINVGLKSYTVFSPHHDVTMIMNSKMMMSLNNSTLASNSEEGLSFGGGFNYRAGRCNYKVVHAMDAQSYYPSTISGANISHETCAIIKVGDLLQLFDNADDYDESHYKFITFCDHKSGFLNATNTTQSLEKIQAAIVPFSYIHEQQENCKYVTLKDLRQFDIMRKIVMINVNKMGILSQIIAKRNTQRNTVKAKKKVLSIHMSKFKKAMTSFVGVIGMKSFNIQNYRLKLEKGGDPDKFLVQIQMKLVDCDEFAGMKNPRESMMVYLDHLNAESVRLNLHYRNLKLLNNSVYGLLGSLYGTLRCKTNAAVVTMLGRANIINAAIVGNSINATPIYSDTDSVYFDLSKAVVDNPEEYIVTSVSNISNWVKLNVELLENVFVVARKTYLMTSDGIVSSRGITKKGPYLWKYMMEKLYHRYIVSETPLTDECVFDVMKEIYTETFQKVAHDKTLVLKSINIRDREQYKREIPITKLIDRIAKEYPTYVFGNKINVFYKTIVDVSNVHFALDFELNSTKLENINIFKFYNNMTMIFYNIISYAIERTVRQRHDVVIKYSSSAFKRTNKLAYIDTLNDVKGISQ
nr:DNA polymerase [Menippe mercenaria nudivirus]